MIIPAVQGLNRFLLDEVDEFICVSKFVADSLVRAGFPRKRTSVVYNWVDIGMSEALGNAHRNPSECRDFLFVGNLGRIKGVLSLLRAVDLLGNSISGRKVDIIGSGSDYPLLRRFALKSGIMSRIRFVGSVSNQELVRAYNSSRAVICPSEWHEPCPTVVLEAMAMGRPVIATKVGGIPELVENTMTGLLVDPSSPDQLASAIRLLSEGDAQVDRMGELGYRRAKTKFGIASNMDVILRKYEKYQTNENPTLPTGATV